MDSILVSTGWNMGHIWDPFVYVARVTIVLVIALAKVYVNADDVQPEEQRISLKAFIVFLVYFLSKIDCGCIGFSLRVLFFQLLNQKCIQ